MPFHLRREPVDEDPYFDIDEWEEAAICMKRVVAAVLDDEGRDLAEVHGWILNVSRILDAPEESFFMLDEVSWLLSAAHDLIIKHEDRFADCCGAFFLNRITLRAESRDDDLESRILDYLASLSDVTIYSLGATELFDKDFAAYQDDAYFSSWRAKLMSGGWWADAKAGLFFKEAGSLLLASRPYEILSDWEMHQSSCLAPTQAQRFWRLFSSLVSFAAEKMEIRLHNDARHRHTINQEKFDEVFQAIWKDRQIIDDYVKFNPHQLNELDILTISYWKQAIDDCFVVMGQDDYGRYLFLHANGVFAVQGISFDIGEYLSSIPSFVKATLLPFGGSVILVGDLAVADAQIGPGIAAALEEALTNAERSGLIIETEVDFINFSFALEERDGLREIDDLLRELEGKPDPAENRPTVRKGALADLSREDRERVILNRREHQMLSAADITELYAEKVCDGPIETDLAKLLMLLTKDRITELGKEFQISGMSKLKKAELANYVAERIAAKQHVLEEQLVWCDIAVFEAFKRIVESGGRVDFGADEFPDMVARGAQEPFTFAFATGDGYTAIVPSQIMQIASHLSLDRISETRELIGSLHDLASACTWLYGVVSIKEMLAMSQKFCDAQVNEWDALFLLQKSAAEYLFEPYRAVASRRIPYVLNPGLFDIFLHEEGNKGGIHDYDTYHKAADKCISYVKSLQEGKPRKVPDGVILDEFNLFSYAYELPETLKLQEYLDAHVPGGDADMDYVFAHLVIDISIFAIMQGGGIHDILPFVEESGAVFDSMEEYDEFLVLLKSMMDAIPRWEHNGWSASELADRAVS